MKYDSEYLAGLRQLAQRVRGADPALHGLAYFKTPTDDELGAVRKSVVVLLSDAVDSAQEFLDGFLPQLSSTPVEDLTHIVEYEVRKELEGIENNDVEDSTTWHLGITAVQLLSKVLKGATAIENAYCQELGLESEISHVAEVATAIEIRRSYMKFWRALDRTPPETPQQVEQRLRSSATLIARLRGRPVFLDLRPLDRRLLLSLHRRIQEWLVSGGSTEPGLQVWHEVTAFADLLRMINSRMELVEHDMGLVPELLAILGTYEPGYRPLALDEALLHQLLRLQGRDDALDELLALPSQATAGALVSALASTEVTMLADRATVALP
ncbi:MAG: hypothetical protein AAGN66_25370 [Acidobacteriota bacterium]